MSREKLRAEAARWQAQAVADVAAARSSTECGHHEWACFQAQQAAEKALKAAWFQAGLDPWGHSLVRLVQEAPDPLDAALASLIAAARKLDKHYIPTRYPNGLPDLTPADVYSEEDAREAIAAAAGILEATARLLG